METRPGLGSEPLCAGISGWPSSLKIDLPGFREIAAVDRPRHDRQSFDSKVRVLLDICTDEQTAKDSSRPGFRSLEGRRRKGKNRGVDLSG